MHVSQYIYLTCFCTPVQIAMTSEMVLKNLRDELWKVINSRDMNLTEFSVYCGISYENLHQILNSKKKDMQLSTLISICENANISYAEIFEITNSEIFEHEILKMILSDGKKNYRITRI